MKVYAQQFDIPEEMKNLVRIYRITVDVIMERIDEPVAASTILPLQHPDGSDDIIALEDYECFIINALEIFDEHDYVVLEERDSPYSHSYYCTLVKRDQLEKMDYKYIYYLYGCQIIRIEKLLRMQLRDFTVMKLSR